MIAEATSAARAGGDGVRRDGHKEAQKAQKGKGSGREIFVRIAVFCGKYGLGLSRKCLRPRVIKVDQGRSRRIKAFSIYDLAFRIWSVAGAGAWNPVWSGLIKADQGGSRLVKEEAARRHPRLRNRGSLQGVPKLGFGNEQCAVAPRCAAIKANQGKSRLIKGGNWHSSGVLSRLGSECVRGFEGGGGGWPMRAIPLTLLRVNQGKSKLIKGGTWHSSAAPVFLCFLCLLVANYPTDPHV